MTNTPESDTMKTLTELAKEQGAEIVFEGDDTSQIPVGCIIFDNEAQLLATFNAWSAQQGWKLVPIEPTIEMKHAAVNHAGDCILQEVYPNGKFKKAVSLDSEMFGEAYKAMLSASPLKG
jgi:hypothetical protein